MSSPPAFDYEYDDEHEHDRCSMKFYTLSGYYHCTELMNTGDTMPSENTLVVAHSPDPDDAFMYYGLAKELVTVPGYRIEHHVDDIHTLNQLALRGEPEVTAISAAAYPQVQQHYRIMTVGASVGRRYGPIVVTREPIDLAHKRIAVPGLTTTARMLSHFYLPEFEEVEIPFDRIFDAVAAGRVDAGVIIHEGQLTYTDHGFVKVLDLGECWFEETGLPIPLGLDVISRRLSEETARRFAEVLTRSILLAYDQLAESTAYAQTFGRGIDPATNERFVKMYVNHDTLDLGTEGRAALDTLYARAVAAELLETPPALDFVAPEDPALLERIAEFRRTAVPR